MENLELYWSAIPTEKEKAITYPELCEKWECSERTVRRILHDLSYEDNGDNYVLIRSSQGKGFYKTDNVAEIEKYRKECSNRARRTFAPLKKIDRILKSGEDMQMDFYNNLRAVRLSKNMKQIEVVHLMRLHDKSIDISLLSKFENGVCLPTAYQLCLFSRIYGVEPSELVSYESVLASVENG